ncbi:hypothetical protein [Mycolicibacterium llatzerense]|uniref:hypothetical protein n=1 Tax=Mycolicibacterium llatzerense TaxID=280871 RepID=UPI0021B5B684|nr:hypothetical protein [Mycolicibacterium llatzerense]
MTDYYARRTGGPRLDGRLVGPFRTYSSAMDEHTRFLEWNTIPLEHCPRMHVLLDLTTLVPSDGAEMERILHTDPVIKSIFELGRHFGRRDAEQWPRTELRG